MEGYLIKISKGRWATINNRRYFALKVGGRFLVYYDKKPTEIKHIPKKLIPTETILSVDRIESKDGKKFSFNTKDTRYLLKAYNKADREAWFKALTRVITRAKKDQKDRQYSVTRSNRLKKPERELRPRRRSQNFTTTDPKMNLSILMKIQTDTTSTYETDKLRFETLLDLVKMYKKKIFETIVGRDLLFNEEYKKIDITEENFQIFDCEIAKTPYKKEDVTKQFGRRARDRRNPFEVLVRQALHRDVPVEARGQARQDAQHRAAGVRGVGVPAGLGVHLRAQAERVQVVRGGAHPARQHRLPGHHRRVQKGLFAGDRGAQRGPLRDRVREPVRPEQGGQAHPQGAPEPRGALALAAAATQVQHRLLREPAAHGSGEGVHAASESNPSSRR